LHIINSLDIGGAEKLASLLVAELRNQSVQADLLVIDRHQTIFHKQLEEKGFLDTKTLGFKSFYNPIAAFKLAYYLRFKANDYDIYHAHLFPTQYWTAFAALVARVKGKLVTTEQNTTNRRREMKFFNFLDKYIYRRYLAITTVSPIATEYLQNYVASKKIEITTIPNAIDLNVFENCPQIDLPKLTNTPNDSLFAIQVSSFTNQKAHDTLIKAISKSSEKLHLILVGDGERLDKMKQLAHSLNVHDRVHFIGIRNDIPSLLKAADIAVLSSHYEGLSLSLIEAFASGTPFIGTNSPGLGEITKQGGVVVKHEDADDLANALNHLCDDGASRDDASQRGLTLAKQFSIEEITKHYIAVYQSMLNEQAS